MRKVKGLRTYNLNRTGTIICRVCNKKSLTPLLHIKHVRTAHLHLSGYCPFCQTKTIITTQTGRMRKIDLTHLKFCCFFHKVENTQERKLFNRIKNKTDEEYKTADKYISAMNKIEICKTSMLTIQHLTQERIYSLNVVQYELIPYNIYGNNILESCLADNNKRDKLSATTLPNANTFTCDKNFNDEVNLIRIFISNYALNICNIRPEWFRFYLEELKYDIETLVAKNKLEFSESENIDCDLIRKTSLHWKKFSFIKYSILLTDFLKNINFFKKLIKEKLLIITRYMKITIDNSESQKYHDRALLSTILIVPRGSSQTFQKSLVVHSLSTKQIGNLDCLIDLICMLSSENQNFDDVFEVIKTKNSFKFDNNFTSDILHVPNREELINVFQPQEVTIKRTTHIYMTPLKKNAKLYFYSQTIFGCVRAFDRALQSNNLVDYITSVVNDNGKFYILYSSFVCNKNLLGYDVKLKNCDSFAEENFYREIDPNTYNKYLEDKQLFFLNWDNIKVVLSDVKHTREENKNCAVSSAFPQKEYTIFPHCFIGTNIHYLLSQHQIDIYNVTMYHRRKIMFEFNSIPQPEDFSLEDYNL